MKLLAAHFIAQQRGAGTVKTLCGRLFEVDVEALGWEKEGRARGGGHVTSSACGSCAVLHDAVIEMSTGLRAEDCRPLQTMREKGEAAAVGRQVSFADLERAVDARRG